MRGRVSPKLWRVRVVDSVMMGGLFDGLIITPILMALNDRERSKVSVLLVYQDIFLVTHTQTHTHTHTPYS